jgi:hypothetical protein
MVVPYVVGFEKHDGKFAPNPSLGAHGYAYLNYK